ncbi:hypothetical protein [Campylobacter sputorum]|uniref:hypothetical protein n=1 Tax=Campylobacter sputorum TaxID=206 RepID=UPI000B79301C|nr:hypothetical protein [Campylobacter sputorum]
MTGNTLNFTNSSFTQNSKYKNINNAVLIGVGKTIENNTVNISNSTNIGNVRTLVVNVSKALSSEIGTIGNNVINIESSTLENIENINLRVNQNSKVYSKNVQGNVVNIKDDTTINGDVRNIQFHTAQQSKFTNISNNKINIEGSNIKIDNVATIAMKSNKQNEGYNYTLSTNSNSNISDNSVYMKLGNNVETKNIFGHDVVITNHNTGVAENIKTANIYANVVDISNIKDSTFGAINANGRVNIINNNNLKFDGNIKSATSNIEISSNDITAKNISAPNGSFAFSGRNLSADSISVSGYANFSGATGGR